jgi:hypothetical protein
MPGTNACASTALGPRMLPPSPTVHYTKRLADKILVAFHHACDQGSHNCRVGLAPRSRIHGDAKVVHPRRCSPHSAEPCRGTRTALAAAESGERRRGWGAVEGGLKCPPFRSRRAKPTPTGSSNKTCGGPIEVAVITSDREFRWVRHKGWDVAI